jgi:hypothetical protein
MNFAVIGIENQEELDYALPLRVMDYDTMEYESQAAVIRKKIRRQKKGFRSGEYLYGFAKESRLHPVITFVLYFGEEEWDGAKDLHGIVDFTDIPEELRDMVPNYKIQLVEVRKLEDTSVFQTDVKQVFDFIRCSNDKEKLKQLVNSDAAYQDMEEDAYDMAAQYSGIHEIILAKDNHYEREGHLNMGSAVRKMIEEIREEGREEGRNEEQAKTIEKLLSKGYTCEAIADMLDVDQEEIQRIRSKMLHLV